jgi:pSer/pThr/pTyr-binding forkhead associated (FHA) protein
MVHYYISVATANIDPMSYPNSNPAPNSGSAPSTGFNAQTQMGLAEVLQMCCLSRRSGQITFRSGESYGYVYIQQGRVLHALCGGVEGDNAIYRMLSWPGGGFSLDEDILPHKKTISYTWEQLLFEGARRADGNPAGLTLTPGAPVITSEPVTSTRAHDSQPKLIIMRPEMPPLTFDLVDEYTHVGRAEGNEIALPYPSISNRHCIFILSGPDIVLRDLNSSNGTLVNAEVITETILRPGDVIQVGVVEIRFEPGVRRPKLSAGTPAAQVDNQMVEVKHRREAILSGNTVKLPQARTRAATDPQNPDDSDFVKGMSAISYDNLAKPERPKHTTPWVFVLIGVVVMLAILAAAYYFFFVLHATR